MTDLLQRAIAEMQKLPADAQDAIAARIRPGRPTLVVTTLEWEAEVRLALAQRGHSPSLVRVDHYGGLRGSNAYVNPLIFGGKPIIRGRRLAVEHVLGMLAGPIYLGAQIIDIDVNDVGPRAGRADNDDLLIGSPGGLRRVGGHLEFADQPLVRAVRVGYQRRHDR